MAVWSGLMNALGFPWQGRRFSTCISEVEVAMRGWRSGPPFRSFKWMVSDQGVREPCMTKLRGRLLAIIDSTTCFIMTGWSSNPKNNRAFYMPFGMRSCLLGWDHAFWDEIMPFGMRSCLLGWDHAFWDEIMPFGMRSCLLGWDHAFWDEIIFFLVQHVFFCWVGGWFFLLEQWSSRAFGDRFQLKCEIASSLDGMQDLIRGNLECLKLFKGFRGFCLVFF